MKAITVISIALVLMLFGTIVTYAQADSVQVHLPFFQISAPVVAQQEPEPAPDTLTIQGTILSTGEAITNANIELWTSHPNISNSSRLIGEVVYQSSGEQSFTYQFNEIPRLENGYTYNIVYDNETKSEGLLQLWITADIFNPLDGNIISMAPIDVADVTLDNPKDGKTVSLPHDFEWNIRDTQSDLYSIQFYQRDTSGKVSLDIFLGPFRHPIDEIELLFISKSGFKAGIEYRWRVWVRDGIGGIGLPLDNRRITFEKLASVSASSDTDSDWSQSNHLPELDGARLEQIMWRD